MILNRVEILEAEARRSLNMLVTELKRTRDDLDILLTENEQLREQVKDLSVSSR